MSGATESEPVTPVSESAAAGMQFDKSVGYTKASYSQTQQSLVYHNLCTEKTEMYRRKIIHLWRLF